MDEDADYRKVLTKQDKEDVDQQIKEVCDYFDTGNINVYIVEPNKLPVKLTSLPDYLTNLQISNYYHYGLYYNYVCDTDCIFLLTNGIYVYYDIIEGSGSGYSCCKNINMYLTFDKDELLRHIPVSKKWLKDFVFVNSKS
jgi:hypothetical protein